MKSALIHIRLDAELREALNLAAKKQGQTVSEFVREAVLARLLTTTEYKEMLANLQKLFDGQTGVSRHVLAYLLANRHDSQVALRLAAMSSAKARARLKELDSPQ